MMLPTLLAVLLLATEVPDLENGRRAYARQEYAQALTALGSAEQALRAAGNEAGLIDCLRLRAAVLREWGEAAQAEQALVAAAETAGKLSGEASPEYAAILEEIAAVQRAQGHAEPALATIEKSIKIREAQNGPPRPELARDLTFAATLRQQAGQTDPAVELFKRAVQQWDASAPGDPLCLPALEALGTIYRDRSQYAEAEPLFLRALRLREIASGPENAELIQAVDSLAYVEFGLKKMPEAETLYKRLLDLWQKNAGPEHPMVALTCDKMAEFYAFQQRYAEAEKFAYSALELRTRGHVASLNQTGRMLLMQAKMDEAEDLYKRTIRIGDLANAPDEAMDPPLRIYAKILRELKRDNEAAPLEKRVKDALIRKGDREGRRPSPVK